MNIKTPQQIARETAYQISACWRGGKFRKAGGVIAGMEPIILSAIEQAFKNDADLNEAVAAQPVSQK